MMLLKLTKLKATENSDVVVITSGIPRKPGMSRTDLIGVNSKIVKGVMDQALKHSEAVFIIVSNPVDTLLTLHLKTVVFHVTV